MYTTPASNRLHIGIFGRRNAGKSSLINALTGQDLAIVSSCAGTTTDPVYKAMEILPIGPCVLIDTAGLDDEGELGRERVLKTRRVLRKTDVGLIVMEPGTRPGKFEEEIIAAFGEQGVPFLIVWNKSDLEENIEDDRLREENGRVCVKVSSVTGAGIEQLKEQIIRLAPRDWAPVPLVKDIVKAGDTVVLVCPIDGAMPQGRLILPQVQVLREVLDAGGIAVVVKDSGLTESLDSLERSPALVITDSQVFEEVKDKVPENVPLTSFSVVFARHKGDLAEFIKGAGAVKRLQDGDEVLIAEACTHHVQPEDIGRSKIPSWLREYTGRDLVFDVTAGGEFPEDLSPYSLVISCGGCMVTRRELLARVARAKRQKVPITNYGIIISYMSGILERVITPFGDRAREQKNRRRKNARENTYSG
ncbi:MAG: [FeFe] hydrogenase H-cluster maturation GTPase HydF [Candidatus Omnitrophica bacterium]|nr:[FeFe] hydrogenase H-cluster maturation GTPase HydF [Candidatus Omnitrophota bacterium]